MTSRDMLNQWEQAPVRTERDLEHIKVAALVEIAEALRPPPRQDQQHYGTDYARAGMPPPDAVDQFRHR